ncbi:acyl-CoA-binding domain-containing protein 6 isoform X2, partial [Tachysurus ichikawai]
RGERRTAFGGAAVSCLYQQETIREEDKNIFDYCRENNIEQVRTALGTHNVDVNTKDEESSSHVPFVLIPCPLSPMSPLSSSHVPFVLIPCPLCPHPMSP